MSKMSKLRSIGSALAIASFVPVVGALSAGCDGCSPSSSGSSGADAATTPDGGSAEAASDAGSHEAGPESGGALGVSPAAANVLTCDTQQFTATGGTGTPAWSVSPASGAGTISASGEYAAPNASPGNPAVTVTATEGSLSASASVQVATAFPGNGSLVPIGSDGNATSPSQGPIEKLFSVSGGTVYVGVLGPTATTGANPGGVYSANVFVSTNAGQTFTGPTTVPTGSLGCVTVAPDVGDPNVVYLVWYGGPLDTTGNSGGTMRLAVSTDGAKTFPAEYVLAQNVNVMPSLICPDVVSPSPDHVIVAAVEDGENGGWVGTWVSSNRGAGIGVLDDDGGVVGEDAGLTEGNGSYAPETNSGSETTCGIASDNGYSGPRIATNGKGDACLVFEYEGPCGQYTSTTDGEIFVQCSSNDGATWTAPLALAGPNSGASNHPTISVSPSGNVAVTWLDTVATDAGGTAVLPYVAISKDLGQTFGTPILYTPPADLPSFGTSNPNVAWENDQVLWLSMTLNVGNYAVIAVDKTCDYGTTWSGALPAGADYTTSVLYNYTSSSLILTSAGMAVGGYGYGMDGGASPNMVLIPLDAP